MRPETITSSCEPCASALASLRGSHGAVKAQNSAPVAGGRPRAEAHDTDRIALVASAAPGPSRRVTRIERCSARLTVTVGKLAVSPLLVSDVVRMHFSRHPFLVLGLALAAACSGRDKSSAQTVGDTVGAAHRTVVLLRSAVPYRSAPVASAGRITGTVQFDGVPPGDTTIIVPADQNGCGKPLVVQLLSRDKGKLANAVVWLTDVREGRSLPADRRFELTNDDCAWSPQVQAVVTGGALNVVNYDPLAENAFATNVESGDTVLTAPFTDDGQVIPYDRLLRTPGVFEFSVESRPMSRAWVVAMDQPYFAVTDAHGAFTIDSVPPGVHHIRAWHPMLGVTDGTVTVAANGTATVNLTFR
jgi:hypothetical protein